MRSFTSRWYDLPLYLIIGTRGGLNIMQHSIRDLKPAKKVSPSLGIDSPQSHVWKLIEDFKEKMGDCAIISTQVIDIPWFWIKLYWTLVRWERGVLVGLFPTFESALIIHILRLKLQNCVLWRKMLICVYLNRLHERLQFVQIWYVVLS